jgi:hypothetical protein
VWCNYSAAPAAWALVEGLVREVKQCEAAETRERMAATDLSGAIHEHVANRPDAAGFPTDTELADWQRTYNQLLQQRNAAHARANGHTAAAAHPRLRAIGLDAQLVRLRYRVRALEAVARGEKPGGMWEGSIARV